MWSIRIFRYLSSYIYMHENLTLQKRLLFLQVWDVTKYNYKYMWIKHPTTLVRVTGSKPVIELRSVQDVNKPFLSCLPSWNFLRDSFMIFYPILFIKYYKNSTTVSSKIGLSQYINLFSLMICSQSWINKTELMLFTPTFIQHLTR